MTTGIYASVRFIFKKSCEAKLLGFQWHIERPDERLD